MIILDTDAFSLLELPDSPAYHRLRARIAQVDPPVPVATTVITYEEQSRGRLASIAQARNDRQLLSAYFHLRQHITNYRKIPLLEFDESALAIFKTLTRQKLRLATLDLRIAAITLAQNATLISRNLSHFSKVPGLRVEDWTQ